MQLSINVLSSEKRESKKGNTYYQNTIMVSSTGAVGKVLTQNKLPLGENEYPVRFKNDGFLNLVLAIDENVPE